MKRSVTFILSLTLISVSTSGPAFAATPKAGGTCTKLGSTVISAGMKFTCVKVKSKLSWNKGTASVTKPQAVAPAKITFISNQKNWGVPDSPIAISLYSTVTSIAATNFFADLPPTNSAVTANVQFEGNVIENVKNRFTEAITYTSQKYSGYLAAGERFDFVGYSSIAWGTTTAQALDSSNQDLARDLANTMPRFGENPTCSNGLPMGGGFSLSYLKNPTLMLSAMNCATSSTNPFVVGHEFTHGIQSEALKSLGLQDPNPASWGPSWLREGQAQAASAILAQWSGASHTTETLKSMVQSQANPQTKPSYLQYLESNDPVSSQEYSMGVVASNYLIARSGWTKSLQVWVLAASLATNLQRNEATRMINFAQAFKTIYGQSLVDFYAEVEPYLEWQYANKNY
jgi:hypothetical protein